LVYKGLLEYGIKFRENCSLTKKTASHKWRQKNSLPYKKFLKLFFFFLLLAEFLEVYDKKEKSLKNIFYCINGGKTPFGYTFRVGNTYRVDCKI
jgi:hypothetical protein